MITMVDEAARVWGAFDDNYDGLGDSIESMVAKLLIDPPGALLTRYLSS